MQPLRLQQTRISASMEESEEDTKWQTSSDLRLGSQFFSMELRMLLTRLGRSVMTLTAESYAYSRSIVIKVHYNVEYDKYCNVNEQRQIT